MNPSSGTSLCTEPTELEGDATLAVTGTVSVNCKTESCLDEYIREINACGNLYGTDEYTECVKRANEADDECVDQQQPAHTIWRQRERQQIGRRVGQAHRQLVVGGPV